MDSILEKHGSFDSDMLVTDTFTVSSNSLFFDIDNKTLLFLYQPVIGSEPISLYLIYLNYLTIENKILKINSSSGKTFTISYICKLLKISFKNFLVAKKKLEAVGLLKTFIDNKTHDIIFLLQPPLTPNKFFNNDFLKNALMYYLDSEDFILTKKLFITKKINFRNFSDISSEVSESFDSSLLEGLERLKRQSEKEIVTNQDNSGDLSDRHYNTPNLINYEKFSYYLKFYKLEDVVNDELLNFLEAFKAKFHIPYKELFEEYKKFYNLEGELNDQNYLKMVDHFENIFKSKKEENIQETIEQDLFNPNDNLLGLLNEDNTINHLVLNKMRTLSFRNFYFWLFKSELDKNSSRFLFQIKALFQISDLVLNYLIFYSFIKNGFLNHGYIDKIAQTIVHKNLKTEQELKKFFNELIKKSTTIRFRSERFILQQNLFNHFKKAK